MHFFTLAAALLLLSTPSSASDMRLTHATIYTAPGQPPIRDGAILIHNGKIKAIGSTASISSPHVTHLVTDYDCTGMTITAGFWNSHVHILPPELLHAERVPAPALTAQLQTMFTRWGFTTVFDLASILSNTNLIRSRIHDGSVQGPRILTAGEPFWGANGTPVYVKQYLIDNHISMPETTSVPQAIARVDQQIHDGADGIKIFAGSIESDGVLLMRPDIATAVVTEAHKRNRLVFSHPSNNKGVELSLDSGVDILAHVSEDPWSPALIERMKAAHISLIPTLTLFHEEAKKAHTSEQATQNFLDFVVGQLHAYSSAGGQILFGTDIGYINHYDTSEEFTLMSRAGMTFPQILASLTTEPAKRFGYSSHSGTLAPGMDADLVVLNADPATDITALSRVAYTVRSGKILYSDRPLDSRRAALHP
jgi:imidazolonepropionase-like amidohydrolase